MRIRSSLLAAHGPRADLTADELTGAADLIARLAAALAPLETLGRGPYAFGAIVARHRDVMAALSDDGGAAAAFAGPDGNALSQVFDAVAAGRSTTKTRPSSQRNRPARIPSDSKRPENQSEWPTKSATKRVAGCS